MKCKTHKYATLVCPSISASLSSRGFVISGSRAACTSSTAGSANRGRLSANVNSHVPKLVRRGWKLRSSATSAIADGAPPQTTLRRSDIRGVTPHAPSRNSLWSLGLSLES